MFSLSLSRNTEIKMHRFHSFNRRVSREEWPVRFTFPFHYTPHPLSVEAVGLVQEYLRSCSEWQDELDRGKMFGVLVVVSPEGETGFLAAFSGLLDGKNLYPYFVPPVYDLLKPDGFFRIEEEHITSINAEIDRLEHSDALRNAKIALEQDTSLSLQAYADAKRRHKQAKAERDERRSQTSDKVVLEELVKESQFEKAELRRLKQSWNNRLAERREAVDAFRLRIDQLKAERKHRSALLQQQLFEQFVIRNARGEEKDLSSLFLEVTGAIPPAGAGECAAPKLLQYAYVCGFRPLAMAEFWWGASPKTELRRHGCYYPSCKSKCEPILGFMLQGLDVEDNPLLADSFSKIELPVVYEDEWLLVVDKPAGMLSVPGKSGADSVCDRMRLYLPDATGPLVVHRLDMATSGLLVVAKDKRTHQNLQAQFKNRTVKKRYIALLDGILAQEEGTISLPMRPDPYDRPRQVVDEQLGKPAVTHFHVVGIEGNYTRIAFYPETGRTHQLRVHAAHPSGLDLPIRGDELYGSSSDRLYLHAESISFIHPATGVAVTVERKAPF